IIGATLMAFGHFMMAVEQLFLFALLALILGNGCFKPNISTQVGSLYAPGDPRRDRAYSIFYVGINLGAFLAPLVCGTLGERVGWHYGYAAAGVGMVIGLCIYLYALPLLPPDEMHRAQAAHTAHKPLDAGERRAIWMLLALLIPNSLFWATYDQIGNTIILWADANTDRSIDALHLFGGSADPDDVVSRRQSVHDLCLHTVRRRAVGTTGGARQRAGDHHQNGDRLLRRHRGEPDHGRGRAS